MGRPRQPLVPGLHLDPCYPDYGFFKLFDAVDGRFNLTIKLVTDRDVVEAELARLTKVAREQVLSLVDAEDIQPAEPYD